MYDASPPTSSAIVIVGNTTGGSNSTLPGPKAFYQTRVDEISAAWLLYVLSSTHEFDEIPVRHNEEHLNQELSKQVMWGPDTSSILDPNGNRQVHDNSIFEDPHTKCFLLYNT